MYFFGLDSINHLISEWKSPRYLKKGAVDAALDVDCLVQVYQKRPWSVQDIFHYLADVE